MMNYIETKARLLIRKDSVKLQPDSDPPTFLHFLVSTDEGREHSVFRRFSRHMEEYDWNCTATNGETNPDKKTFCCAVLQRKSCSHIRACQIYLEKWRREYDR